MAYDRFLIAPLNTGLETDLKSWQTPDDSFSELYNAYVFRGRVRKRFGSTLSGTNQLNSRLRVLLGNTDGAGGTAGQINLVPPGSKVAGVIYKIGQMFSVGSKIFTVIALGNPTTLLRSDGLADTATFDTTTGELHIHSGLLTTPVYFYPAEPVMGLTMYENGAINNHTAYAFDTQFAYQFTGGSWNQFGPSVGNRWHGTNTNFFWSCNWQGVTPDVFALFTTNFKATINAAPGANDDPIWYYNGTWNTFSKTFKLAATLPATTSNQTIKTARIVVPFKNRLVLLNTIENDGSGATPALGVNRAFPNRCRFSHAASPLSEAAWWIPNQSAVIGGVTYYSSGGGYIDAPTMEEIVSAQFIKDRLIVYFERSTWELAYTGNQILPFVWQKLNTELGVEGTFSVVPFDKVVLGIGTTGIHACNGSNVDRIDDKIPDKVFDLVHKPDAVKRIAGIRDYKTEMVYWAAPMNNADSDALYPDTILVYNYRNNSWAFNNDSFTAFGYFEQQDGRTWQASNFSWNSTNFTWNSGVSRANYRCIVAGNQQGWILKIDPDSNSNAPALYITGIATPTDTVLTIIDHNLSDGDFIKITNTGLVEIDGNIYQIVRVDANNINIGVTDFGGVYAGGGIAARVSRIDMRTKQWNPYVKEGRNFYLAKVDFCTQKTSTGEITVDYFPSSTQLSLVTEAQASGSALGTNILETSPYALVPLEAAQERTWHPIYFQGEGEFVQLRLYLSDSQMLNAAISESAFELEGLTLYCMPTTMRLS